MIKGVRVLNFDDSVVNQQTFMDAFNPSVVDAKHLNRSARTWAFESTVEAINALLKPVERHHLTFLGSSDYHHVTSILLRQFVHPITVIVFDHRPDWSIFRPKMACNAWISRAVEKVNIINVIEFGVGTRAMKFPWKIGGNFASAKGGRLKMYSPHGAPLLPKIINQIYTEDVYISVDKTCLRSDENLSEWEEGRMSLATVLDIITTIGKHKKIIGMDVCGDYSVALHENIFKQAFSTIIHPKHPTALNKDLATIDTVNEQSNIRLTKAIFSK